MRAGDTVDYMLLQDILEVGGGAVWDMLAHTPDWDRGWVEV